MECQQELYSAKNIQSLSKKSAFGQEITKFILYSLLDNRLIPKASEFTYYIVVSNELESNCRDFIERTKTSY
jgi:hypothetical protein